MTIPVEALYFCGGALFGAIGLIGLVWVLAGYQRRSKQ